MGLLLSTEADLDMASKAFERLSQTCDFPATASLAEDLQKDLIRRAKEDFASIPHSGSVLEDYGQANYWEEYKLQMQRPYEGPHTEAYRETMRACCDSVSNDLNKWEKLILRIVVFDPNEVDDEEPLTASDLMFDGLEEIAGFEPLLNDPNDEEEPKEKVDENGDPLFSDTIKDEPMFEEIRRFVQCLFSKELGPSTLCQVAITLNYLDRMPRKTPGGCQLTICYRCNGELSYASIDGDEDRFALSKGGTVNHGMGADHYGEDVFVRDLNGTCLGDLYEIQEWIDYSQELINLGGTISSESVTMEDHTWDDGESSTYWQLLD
ncbi:MAG TPA: hypothetical protein DDZ51_28555 [Planctomycetaceae bacterium]|nr:hypothetical protein [Planctomycetaceae bacterium]